MASTLLNGIVLLILLAAASQDLRTRRIWNMWPLLIAAAFAAKMVFLAPDMSWGDFVGPVLVFVVGLALWRYRMIGAGDVKLMAAVCLFAGMPQMLPFLVYTSLFGGILALILLAWQSVRNAWTAQPVAIGKRRIPYAPALLLSWAFLLLPFAPPVV